MTCATEEVCSCLCSDFSRLSSGSQLNNGESFQEMTSMEQAAAAEGIEGLCVFDSVRRACCSKYSSTLRTECRDWICEDLVLQRLCLDTVIGVCSFKARRPSIY